VRLPELLVLRSLATTRCSQHCSGELSLDTAFVLVEGHPRDKVDFTNWIRPTWKGLVDLLVGD
jgi:hypothetical protein